jgi:nitronate monooxygenase
LNHSSGIEAGGHGSATAPPLTTLIPAIRSALGNNCPPLLGAGGIVVGSQVASILTLGADGVVLGTRFSACQESFYSPARKEALLKADLNATVRSLAFDYAPNILGWPDYIDGRALNNEISQFFTKGDPKSVEIIQAKFDEGVKNEDANKLVIWAGASVGLINEIKSAEASALSNLLILSNEIR